MINGLALLGWNPPHKEENSNGEEEKTGRFSKHEVLTMEDLFKMV